MKEQKKLRVGIVGCGAIGSTLGLMVKERFPARMAVAALCDIVPEKARALRKKLPGAKVCSLPGLIRESDIVIEAAGAGVSFDIARRSLAEKKDVVVMSVAGVLGREKKLFALARKNRAGIYFPSGAICGIDGIKALALSGVASMTLKTFKPPRALEGAPYLLERGISVAGLKKDRVVFDGPARRAVKAFPQNINVVALLSLAAEGQAEPRVQIIASPKLKRNVHEISVVSRAAVLRIRCENVPSPGNPKTSYLAILSAARTLAGIVDVVRLGN